MTQQELVPSNITPAYRTQLAKAIKALPADQKVKAVCRAVLASDDLDRLRELFAQFQRPLPYEEPELGPFATRKWSVTERLQALASFASVFSNDGFLAGSWRGGLEDDRQIRQMPWFDLDEKAAEFMKATHDYGWVIDIDWPAWAQSPEARRLTREPTALENATAVELARMITVSVRRDRFCEGSLASDFESGLIARIVQRAAVLLHETEAASDGFV